MTKYKKTITESYQEVSAWDIAGVDNNQEITEKLKPSDGAGAYIKDFRKSDAPQFKGKSDDKLKDMAIAAYMDDKEENMTIEGKYAKYSDLLIQKGRMQKAGDKQGEKQTDKEIEKEKKKLGIREVKELQERTPRKGDYQVTYVKKGNPSDYKNMDHFATRKQANAFADKVERQGGKIERFFQIEELEEKIKVLYDKDYNYKVKTKVFSNKKDAEKFVNDIQKKGGKAIISEDKVDEKVMKGFVVRFADKSGERLAIPFKTKDSAKEKVKELKSVGAKDITITTHSLNFKETQKEDMSKYYSDKSLGIGKPKTYNPQTKKFEDFQHDLKEGEQITEAQFAVKIKDLPLFHVDSTSAGKVKAGLKKALRNPKSIESVERVSKSDVKKTYRDRLAGKDQEVKTEDCWTGYKQVGMKDKDGKKVPNCVPEGKTAYEKYTGVTNPKTEGRRSNYASDDDDEEGANKNIIMQLRKSLNLRNMYNVVFDDGKKVKVKEPIARAAIEKHGTFRTSRDKLNFQNKISKSYRDLLQAIR
tara:strand:- start:21315 stop:22904 length:1590 start_codon:yes stop_codon:yes gene_type:complete